MDNADEQTEAPQELTEREELHQAEQDLEQRFQQRNDQLRARIRFLERLAKRRAFRLIIAGVVIGVALIWGASQTNGFWSLLMNGLGTGFLVAATAGVGTYFVARYWKAATEISNEQVLAELRDLDEILIPMSTRIDFSYEVLQHLRLFLDEQEVNAQAISRRRQEKSEATLARAREIISEDRPRDQTQS